MEYRVENKYLVSDQDMQRIAARLKTVMHLDQHQTDGCYEIRSLYFDDILNRCMEENQAGVDQREKYRIRIYDGSDAVIHLEIKEKTRGLTKKRACDITKQEVQDILDGTLPLHYDGRAPLNQLKTLSRTSGMRPKAIIAYERTAFVCETGNVRVTFDRNIMASGSVADFFDQRIVGMVPVLPKGMHVLEVKYDEFLPDFIAKQLEIGTLRKTAFSKYYLGRLAAQGEFVVDI